QTCALPISLVKVTRTRRHGAEVILHGSDFDEAKREAHRLEAAEQRVFVHPFDDPAIIAGQGTLGLELIEQYPHLEMVVIPIGGGGLIAGAACAIKETNPRVKVYGVQTAAIPAMRHALDVGRIEEVPAGSTIADGIAVRRPGKMTFEIGRASCRERVRIAVLAGWCDTQRIDKTSSGSP